MAAEVQNSRARVVVWRAHAPCLGARCREVTESEGGPLQKVRGTKKGNGGREGVATKMHSPPHDWLSLARCLKGKRIIIMGDSTARFEYLTLAFIAHFGMAPSEALPECHKIWGNVNASQVRLPPKAEGCMFGNRYVGKSAFYTFTNELFGGHELCDCYQPQGGLGFEVRLYTPPTEAPAGSEADAGYISYVQWLGSARKPAATFDPARAVHERQRAGRAPSSSGAPAPAPTDWLGPAAPPCPVGQKAAEKAASSAFEMPADAFLRTVVKRMRPTHLIVQCSIWPHRFNHSFWSSLAAAGVEAVHDHGGRVLWQQTLRGYQPACTEQRSRELGWACSPEDVDPTPFVRAGWGIHNVSAIVEPFRRPLTRDDSDVFADRFGVHLKPAPNEAVVRHLVSKTIGCERSAAARGEHAWGVRNPNVECHRLHSHGVDRAPDEVD